MNGNNEIILIDDGVSTDIFSVPLITAQIDFTNIGSGQKISPFSHGSICAAILYQQMSSVSLYSLRVLDDQATGNIEDLAKALRICCHLPARLVHMSLGTVNYHDAVYIAPLIEKLLLQDKIIVAAFSNFNVPTWPAGFPGVFGIRTLNNTYVPESCTALAENTWLKGTNAWVARPIQRLNKRYGGTFPVQLSNSFAAPLLTVKIFRLLQANSNLSANEVQKKLKKDSFPLPDQLPFNDFCWVKSKTANIPIIAVSQRNEETIEETKRILLQKGYPSEIIGTTFNTIPVSLYCDIDELSDRVLAGISYIYDTSILFVIESEESARISYDAQIDGNTLKIGKIEYHFSNGKELAEIIVHIFAGNRQEETRELIN